MKLVSLNGPQDVVALLVRRKWWILLPFLGLSAGILLLAAILPRMYVSESLIIIRPRDVPDDFVKDLIAGTTNERLSMISERVLSDTNLKSILTQFKDQIPELRNLNQQDQIARLRQQVHLQFSSGEQLKKGQLPVSSFRIICQNRDPLIAQKIVKQLTDVFISEDRKNREANVNETAAFLQTQVDDLATKLELSDSKLKQLRSRRRNELPNQLESNLRRIENLSNENQALRRDRTNYLLAQSQLEQQMAEIPKRIPQPPAPPPPRDPDVEEYRQKQAELRTLKNTRGLKDQHPDVVLLNLQLKRLEETMTPEQLALAKKDSAAAAAASAPSADAPTQNNPLFFKMEQNLEFIKKQIEFIDERTSRNDETMRTYNDHVNNVPAGEQELNDVLRENNDLTRQYQELSAKLSSARLSESAENQQKGSQFEIVDPASLPLTPTKPSKSAIVGGGIAFSLLAALALGFLVDIGSQKMWTQSDINHQLGVKVLVEVPRMTTRSGVTRARKKRAGFLTAVGMATAAYGFCLYLAYNHPGFLLRQLDPLIQKLY
jgi:polysaccharide chain length determinant protein (PEP-CTERM system associated)